ncbi:MetK 1 protein [Biomphalaria glabrata]
MKNANYVVVFLISVLIVLVYIALSRNSAEIAHPTVERTKKVAADDTNLSTQSQATLIRQLTDLLLYRLSQPNNAEKILFTESCDTVASKSELACTDYSCQTGINPEPGARVKNMVMSPNLSLTTDQRELILTMGRTIPESDVIILSASSENHYDEMQAMFQNLHTVVYPNMANFTMVLFDIGLTKEQRSTTERNCKCHVVTFPVHLFKAYMKNNFCYAWKPLIVLASIVKARKYLVYQDASVRWLNDFHITFDRTNKYGHQMFRYRNSIRSTLNTYPQMFQFMDEDPCTFTPYPEFHATSMLHKNDQLVIKTVLEPWARCALEETCMCPVEPSKSIVCKRDSFIQHRCHRFDQSAITLIMGKMYGDDIYRFLAPAGDTVGKKCVQFTADKNPNYFKN